MDDGFGSQVLDSGSGDRFKVEGHQRTFLILSECLAGSTRAEKGLLWSYSRPIHLSGATGCWLTGENMPSHRPQTRETRVNKHTATLGLSLESLPPKCSQSQGDT